MSTAATPVNESNPMKFYLEAADTSTTFYFYLHFAELQQLKSEQYRAFNINLNGEHWYGPLAPVYLNTTTITNLIGFSGSSSYNFSIIKLENSTLPPILNGFEAYTAVDFQQSETNEKDGMFFPTRTFSSLVFWFYYSNCELLFLATLVSLMNVETLISGCNYKHKVNLWSEEELGWRPLCSQGILVDRPEL